MKKANKNKRKESVQIFWEVSVSYSKGKERGGGKQIGRDRCKTYTFVFLQSHGVAWPGVQGADWFSLYLKKNIVASVRLVRLQGWTRKYYKQIETLVQYLEMAD